MESNLAHDLAILAVAATEDQQDQESYSYHSTIGANSGYGCTGVPSGSVLVCLYGVTAFLDPEPYKPQTLRIWPLAYGSLHQES